MKFFYKGKDGGVASTVTGYWLVEIKSLFSIAFLKFEGESREAFHTHAFNSLSWVIKGHLTEYFKDGGVIQWGASLKPIVTKRSTFHKVSSYKTTWVLTFRGPWSKQWKEYLPETKEYITLESGRKVVDKS